MPDFFDFPIREHNRFVEFLIFNTDFHSPKNLHNNTQIMQAKQYLLSYLSSHGTGNPDLSISTSFKMGA